MNEDRSLIVEIDKKLGILIGKVEAEAKISHEFKGEVKTEISKIQDRVRTLELTDATNSSAMESFTQIKNSLIKWFVGIAGAAILGSYVVLSTLMKGMG